MWAGGEAPTLTPREAALPAWAPTLPPLSARARETEAPPAVAAYSAVVMRLRPLATLLTAGLLAAAASAAAAPAAAAPKPALCPLPSAPPGVNWGFHNGPPITGTSGLYAHGRGVYASGHSTGRVCEVNRAPGRSDHQVVLTVTRAPATIRPGIHVDGLLGNWMQVPLRVTSSTDPGCPVGRLGTLTLFATYNGNHVDTAQIAFRHGCLDQRHRFSGPSVTALVAR